MKNKITLILSVALLCGGVAPIEANVKKGKEQVKEKEIKKHTPGCTCEGPPPKPPKFWYWFNLK